MFYFFCFLAITIGAILVIKSEWFFVNFGRVDWAEKYLGTGGGTRLFYKLLGITIILISFLVITGTMQKLLLKFFLLG